MMTRYLQGLRIKPGPLLSTALLYGIRTDTATFERSGGEEDLRAYQWLIKHADATLLRRIIRSEYLRAWLPLFSRAFRSLRDCRGGAMVWLNEVDSADLLVAVADFFTRVHGLKWIAVCGVVDKTVVVIFRGDGSRDIGRLADACFYDVGSAGGYRNLGRAEFPCRPSRRAPSPRSSSSSACTAASCARSRPAPRPWPKMPASRPCTARRWNPRPCRPWPTGRKNPSPYQEGQHCSSFFYGDFSLYRIIYFDSFRYDNSSGE